MAVSQSRRSRRGDDRDRYVPREHEEDDGAGPLLDSQDNLRRSAVQRTAEPILERWSWGTAASRVGSRLRRLLGTGLFLIAVYLLFDPGGLTGVILTLWFLLSVPVVVLTAALLVTLRNPKRAADVWWDKGMIGTVGLVALSGVARAGRRSAGGRVAWQLLFDEDGPEGEDLVEESAIDREAVRRIRRYVRYVIIGSAALVIVDQLLRSGILVSGIAGLTGPAGWPGVVAVMGVVGVALGAFAAVYGK